MQTLHRLAGVQEASDNIPAPIPAHSQNLSAPAPPPKDGDRRSQKRASLPINRRPSHRSLRSNRSNKSSSRPTSQIAQESATYLPADYPPTPRLPPEHRLELQQQEGVIPRASADSNLSGDGNGAGEEAEEGEEEFAWGPSHPCFPHPNPHCAPDSAEFHSTRVIRIRRDWLAMGDTYPQYANLYPEILDPLLSDADFRQLINYINSLCERTFSPFTTRAKVDSLLGAFTGYLWEDLGWTGAKKGEAELERFLDWWNRERGRDGVEVRIVQLRRTGFMSLDFVVPDPGIDNIVAEEDEEAEGEDIPQALGS